MAGIELEVSGLRMASQKALTRTRHQGDSHFFTQKWLSPFPFGATIDSCGNNGILNCITNLISIGGSYDNSDRVPQISGGDPC